MLADIVTRVHAVAMTLIGFCAGALRIRCLSVQRHELHSRVAGAGPVGQVRRSIGRMMLSPAEVYAAGDGSEHGHCAGCSFDAALMLSASALFASVRTPFDQGRLPGYDRPMLECV